jgi:hypothetical protein
MVSVLASSAVDRGFEPRSGQTKDCNIATYEGEVDYWKSEVIAFVVEFCFYLPPLSISR